MSDDILSNAVKHVCDYRYLYKRDIFFLWPCYCVCVSFTRKFQPQFCFLHRNVAASFIASPDDSQSCIIHDVRLVQHSTLPFHVAASFIVSILSAKPHYKCYTPRAASIIPFRRDITWAVFSAVTFCGPDNSFCILSHKDFSRYGTSHNSSDVALRIFAVDLPKQATEFLLLPLLNQANNRRGQYSLTA